MKPGDARSRSGRGGRTRGVWRPHLGTFKRNGLAVLLGAAMAVAGIGGAGPPPGPLHRLSARARFRGPIPPAARGQSRATGRRAGYRPHRRACAFRCRQATPSR